MASKAMTAQAMFSKVTWSSGVPCTNLRETTITSPANPSNRPSHCRRETVPCPASRDSVDNQMAVSTGWMPTISDDRPEPMPALTAAHTPPR